MIHRMSGISLLGLFFCLSSLAQEGPISQEIFDQWIDMRVGDGTSPAIWYCFGEVYSYPEGKLLTKMEGIDIAKRLDVTPDSVIQLNRKIFVYTDVETGEVLKSYEGNPVSHILYPYQWITYVHRQDQIVTWVEQGKAPRITKMGPGTNTKYRKVGSAHVFSSPVFLNFTTPVGKYEAYENYDFIIDPSAVHTSDRNRLTWVRYGDAPPFTGEEKCIIQLICYRVDQLSDVSEVLYRYIREEAPLWLQPPQSIEEIRSLQE
jgi:hypothetical protein